jgi:ankyrin repeat protein
MRYLVTFYYLLLLSFIALDTWGTHSSQHLRHTAQVIKANNNKYLTILLVYLEETDQINRQDKHGNTLLHLAVNKNNVDAVKLLLWHRAQTTIANNKGNTPLHCAAYQGNSAIVKLLLAHGAQPNSVNTNDSMPLHKAVYANKQIVELLLKNGAQATPINRNGTSPLHRAADKNDKAIIELLIAYGAQINDKNKSGWTPLHRAAHASHSAIVELLLSYGACSTIPVPILKHIEPHIFEEIMLLTHNYASLIQHAQHPTMQLFDQAIEYGYYGLAKLLIKKALIPNISNLALAKKKYYDLFWGWQKDNCKAIGNLLVGYLALTGELQLYSNTNLYPQKRTAPRNSPAIAHAGLTNLLPKEIVQHIARYFILS